MMIRAGMRPAARYGPVHKPRPGGVTEPGSESHCQPGPGPGAYHYPMIMAAISLGDVSVQEALGQVKDRILRATARLSTSSGGPSTRDLTVMSRGSGPSR
eukprot:768148-Hanusia_phi.AAC.2